MMREEERSVTEAFRIIYKVGASEISSDDGEVVNPTATLDVWAFCFLPY